MDNGIPTSSVTTLDPAPPLRLSSTYAWYVLGLLWLVALFRFVDLQIIAVLLEPIRAEFAFSDTQLALISGFAFALFYSLLGVPIAWLADRYSRRNIIAASVGLWSFMTMLCGMAGSFLTLFLARMGVGIGEAGAYPPTASLLADYFPERQRTRVFAILASAIPIGVFVGFLIGGIVNQYYGWRAAFQFVGLPGIVLAFLVHLTVRELPRGYSQAPEGGPRVHSTVTGAASEPFADTLRQLWRVRSYRHMVLGACLFTLGAYGSGIWIPSWFIRHHGFTTAEIGIWMAMLYGGGGLVGAMAGGWLAEKVAQARGDNGWYMKVCSLSMLATLPFACFVFLWPNPVTALCVHAVITVLMHMNIGPVLAMVQSVAGVRRRAMGQAVNVLVTNIIALPLGPLIVGSLSDAFTPRYGTGVLGLAILGLLLGAWSWSALHFYFSSRHLAADMEAAR